MSREHFHTLDIYLLRPGTVPTSTSRCRVRWLLTSKYCKQAAARQHWCNESTDKEEGRKDTSHGRMSSQDLTSVKDSNCASTACGAWGRSRTRFINTSLCPSLCLPPTTFFCLSSFLLSFLQRTVHSIVLFLILQRNPPTSSFLPFFPHSFILVDVHQATRTLKGS